MRKIALFLTCCLFISCEQKEKIQKYIIVKEDTQTERKVDIVSSDEFNIDDVIEWNGRSYSYNLKKSVDKDLPIVKNNDGQKFYDNQIEINIKSDDGSTFYSHTFKKSSFEQYLPDSFIENGIMEGLAYDKIDESGRIKFIACIAYPQTDEYMLFSVLISKDKSITIGKDNRMMEQ